MTQILVGAKMNDWLNWENYLTEVAHQLSPPSIDDFEEGDVYWYKRNFMDGTVKTLKQYNEAEWIQGTYNQAERPYIERLLTGINSQNLPSAIILDKMRSI